MATKPIYKTITNAAVANFTTEQPANLKGFSVNIDPTLTSVNEVNISHSGTDTSDPDVTTIDLDTTVYGGSISVSEDGEVELTDDYRYIDFSQLTVSAIGREANLFRITFSTAFNDGNTYKIGLCNLLTFQPNYTSANANDMSIAFNNTNGKQMLIRNSSLSSGTDDDIKDFVATLKAIYPKATPVTSELDPIDPIRTLAGVNNIWADTGDILTLTYLERYNYIIEEPVMDISSPLGALWEQAAGIDGTYPIGDYSLLVTKGGDCLATKNGELLEIKGGS